MKKQVKPGVIVIVVVIVVAIVGALFAKGTSTPAPKESDPYGKPSAADKALNKSHDEPGMSPDMKALRDSRGGGK